MMKAGGACMSTSAKSATTVDAGEGEGQIMNLSQISGPAVESYDRIVEDSFCVQKKSKEHNSDRWLAFLNQKMTCKIKRETHCS